MAWLFAVGWEEDDEVEEAVPSSKGTLGRLRRREALLLVWFSKRRAGREAVRDSEQV
jgi:hypothetical protein